MELNTKNLFDFKYLISCTLDDKITWKTLTFFLNDLTPTLPKAKELIRIMLEEFKTICIGSRSSNQYHKYKCFRKESKLNFEISDPLPNPRFKKT